MVKVKKLPKRRYFCTVCDDWATMEISSDGSLQVFWAHGPTEPELTLCKSCARKIRNGLNAIIKSERVGRYAKKT